MPRIVRTLIPTPVDRTYLMGIINLTPDSFSGDGLGSDVAAAVTLARQLEAEGADILDIGGESSRPGATPLPPREECGRVLPALRAVRETTELPISIDTYHAEVAEAALAAGADAVNDVWGLRRDAEMARVVARYGAWLVAMHNQRGREFHDVIGDIRAGFETSLAIAGDAGIDPARIVLDPGFGFGWAPEQNLEMIRRLGELAEFGHPLLVGASRKSTLGYILNSPPNERFEGTAASVSLAIAGGASIVRVHDVARMRKVVKVADAIVRANWRHEP